LPFALGNVLGPWLLGRLFDTIGRVPMIAGCYFLSGGLMAATGYLTVSEVFPMEIQAMAIALFYSIAAALGGISGPVIFGQLIGTGNATNLFIAYLVGAGFMIVAAVVEVILGVRAEGQSLENAATPLTAIEEATGSSAAARA
jgi:MFS family permease